MAGLALMAATVEGVGGGHRHAMTVQQEAFRTAERLLAAKDCSPDLRLGCASVLRALAHCGGAFLWAAGLSGLASARSLCLQELADAESTPAVRLAFAQALGEMAFAASSDAAKQSVRDLEKKPRAAAAQVGRLHEAGTLCCPSGAFLSLSTGLDALHASSRALPSCRNGH